MSRWIECDGTGMPKGIPVGPLFVKYVSCGIAPPDSIPANWPGFYWRWTRVKTGWFKSERRRVCLDPKYAPVIAIRITKPRALLELIALAANPPALVEDGANV